MEKQINNLPIPYLQHLANLHKIAKQKSSLAEFKINKKNVYENVCLDLLDGEIFKKHPNLNLDISNYGRIKDNEIIVKQEIENEGYLYISLFFPSSMFNNDIANKKEYKIYTPSIVFNKINIDKEIKPIYNERYTPHPFINIYRNKRGNFFSINNNHKYFYKICTNKNGEDGFFIPLYVYRLVAETWITKPKGCTEVHHIINNGYNNTAYNLMWVTHSQHKLIEQRNF
ncbi:hypothetical protein R84B8_02204 [Treponema sp. R8-4-B8]